MSKYTLDEDQQIIPPKGGDYFISTTFNGGAASLHVQQSNSSEWVPLGTLTEQGQVATLPYQGLLRLTKTGNAIVEVSGL